MSNFLSASIGRKVFMSLTGLFLISFLFMIVRPSGKNPERLLKIDHPGSKLVLPAYLFSFVDIALIFTYLAVIG